MLSASSIVSVLSVISFALFVFTSLYGVYSLVVLAAGRIFDKKPQASISLIKAEGSGDGVEEAVRCFAAKSCSPIILVDCGLDGEGKRLTERLYDEFSGLSVLSPEELPMLFKVGEASDAKG